jgi:integrase
MHPEIFGPLALKEVRKWLVAQELSRGVINQRIGIVKRLFRWAASEQLVPGNVWHALEAVTGLRANERVGDKVVQDRPKVRPVAEGIVRETMKAMTPTVAAMTELQLLTGMRSEELTSMRVCDIDRSRDTWVYKPLHHKTEHHGSDHVRVVFLGPKAQALLMPYFDRALERRGLAGHLFTPADATKERFVTMRAARQSSVQPSHVCRAKEAPILRPGDCYNTNSYGRAVHYALVKRNAQLAAEALKPYHVDKLDKIKDKKVLKAATAAVEASQLPNWHPHQLRHTAGTLIRKVGGRDAARAFLGHKESRITDDYAEIDETLAVDMARKIG